MRQRHGKRIWQLILARCQEVAGETSCSNDMVNHWPKDSPLGKAVRYIIRNFPELTAYLGDAEFFLTNNICERMLRREQMMLMASKYRRTKRGRAVFDILQTMIATCSAAGVQLKDYLPFLYKNRDHIPEHPEDYTPYAFAKFSEKKAPQRKVS
jgi:hypothetical protein